MSAAARANARMRSGPIDRATADDVVSLATDVGPAPMQAGAVLVLGTAELDVRRAASALAERIAAVPRLRQRLVPTPPGCGRPVWIDDADFDIDDQVDPVACPDPGDERALLAIAATTVGARLPSDRPLWRMTIVSGLDGDRTALIVAFHHVLADGIGGLAVLANLVDGASVDHAAGFPRPGSSTAELAFDAARGRLAATALLPSSLRRLCAALVQLRPTANAHAERCSLNRPTGAERRFRVVRADLDAMRHAAHTHAATINDVVLTAAAAALHTLLLSRGDPIDEFVVSVPVSARRAASAT